MSPRVFLTLWMLLDGNDSDGGSSSSTVLLLKFVTESPAKLTAQPPRTRLSTCAELPSRNSPSKDGPRPSWELGFHQVATQCFPFWPSPDEHQSSLTLPAHCTHKHSFSWTELTARMNLNSKLHKSSICFNSCFDIEASE